MDNGNTAKPWFLCFLARSPNLLKLAHLLNQKVLFPAGLKVVPASSLTIAKEWPHRLLYFQRLFTIIEDIAGDIVECGVGPGTTLVTFALLARNSETKRHIWGYDSFGGLPKPGREDMSSPRSLARKGMFGEASETTVWSNLSNAGFDRCTVGNEITLVKGWFADTLPKVSGPPIALLHLDADLYESTKCALENLWHRVAIGGVVAFDQYHKAEKWPGEKRAVDEYFSQHPGEMEMHRDAFYDRYYAIKTKRSTSPAFWQAVVENSEIGS